MTRINCVPPSMLCRQHLVAEYRELPRVFTLVERRFPPHPTGAKPMNMANIPATYRLGSGHVLFFYDKLEWLRRRHAALVREMHTRGYSTTIDCSRSGLALSLALQNDWEPSRADMALNMSRLVERLPHEYRDYH